jgi:hypothetical protein
LFWTISWMAGSGAGHEGIEANRQPQLFML